MPFVFDRVFQPSTTQEQIYDDVGKQVVSGMRDGRKFFPKVHHIDVLTAP
jgi:hypothetical protein